MSIFLYICMGETKESFFARTHPFSSIIGRIFHSFYLRKHKVGENNKRAPSNWNSMSSPISSYFMFHQKKKKKERYSWILKHEGLAGGIGNRAITAHQRGRQWNMYLVLSQMNQGMAYIALVDITYCLSSD